MWSMSDALVVAIVGFGRCRSVTEVEALTPQHGYIEGGTSWAH
jgi:hypothetical protein